MKKYYLSSWDEFFRIQSEKKYFQELMDFVDNEYQNYECFPDKKDIFKIFQYLNPNDIKVIFLGQDPYHTPTIADGIAFSSKNQNILPPSLRNLFKELKNDLNIDHFNNHSLLGWVKQGVFLTNTILTVRKANPLSHKNKGWEIFITEAIKYILLNNDVIFVLLGEKAKKYAKIINGKGNSKIIEEAHPSPFSYKKFQNSKIYSKINLYLNKIHKGKINWEK